QKSVCLTRIVQGNDQWMPQARDNVDLTKKSVGTDGRGERLVHYFDGYVTVMLAIARPIHDGHAPAADDIDHLISVSERRGKARRGIVQEFGEALGGRPSEQCRLVLQFGEDCLELRAARRI